MRFQIKGIIIAFQFQTMTRLRILCTRKKSIHTHLKEITHVGGLNGTGDRWNITAKEAVQRIQSGENAFFIVDESQELKVTIVGTNQHLFVTAPGFLHNFLEDLPDCP